jgi:hypothetical protein
MGLNIAKGSAVIISQGIRRQTEFFKWKTLSWKHEDISVALQRKLIHHQQNANLVMFIGSKMHSL